MKYFYSAVGGCACFSNSYSIYHAKKVVKRLREGIYNGLTGKRPDAEIERVLLFNGGGKRYWRWRNGKWSLKFWTDPSKEDLKRWDI